MAASDELSLFEEKRPFGTSAVWACVVYSLVPFVGVVFAPLVFVFGIVGVVRSDRSVFKALGVGLLILMVQLVLWWLLFAVPTWSTGLVGS